MPRETPVTTKNRIAARAVVRVLRHKSLFWKTAPMSVAWLGLALMSIGSGPWSTKDLACMAVLLVCGVWRG